MPLGIRLHYEVRQILVRGLFEVVMPVDHGCIRVKTRCRSEDKTEPVGHVHKTSERVSHNFHPLPALRAKELLGPSWSQCPYFTPEAQKRTRRCRPNRGGPTVFSAGTGRP